MENRKSKFQNEKGHSSRWWRRNTAFSADEDRLQTASADLRQTDDLLSLVDLDARRAARGSHHLDTKRFADAAGLFGRWGATRYSHRVRRATEARRNRACFFGYQVRDPERYGVVEFDAEGKAISLEEKPRQPKSPFAVPGLYVYDDQVVDLCRTLRPSARAELEITDLNLLYLQRNELHVKLLSRGMAWLDTGTTTTLLEASNYIATIEHRQGLKIACLEEVALRMGFIAQSDLAKIIDRLPKNEYRQYLRMVCDEGPSASPEPVG